MDKFGRRGRTLGTRERRTAAGQVGLQKQGRARSGGDGRGQKVIGPHYRPVFIPDELGKNVP